jgi:Protein of unknown function (DUF664)
VAPEVAYAQRFVEAFEGLGTTALPDEGEEIAVREVLVRVIEEDARHCGHADLLRERIDGRVGSSRLASTRERRVRSWRAYPDRGDVGPRLWELV